MARRSRFARATDAAGESRLVQPKPGNALAHDPEPDRNSYSAGDDASDGHVRRPRARAGNLRPAPGDALPPGGNHGRQIAAVYSDRAGPSHQRAARRTTVVPNPVLGVIPGALRGLEPLPAR